MARPKKRSDIEPIKSSALLDALKFCGLICKDTGPINETHVYLGAHWATAFNGVISCGVPILENINCCPQSKLIIQALTKCEEQISFTQLSINQLSIKSGKFKAIVPCIDPSLLHLACPDPPIASINDEFKIGLGIVGILTNENAQNIYSASILMNGKSLVATNSGRITFEYWHGIDLPSEIALPKALVEPLTSTVKKLVKFGFSQSSVTFYFEDESWIKSQLYNDKWPDIDIVFGRPSNPWPLPTDFWTALDAIGAFSEGLAYFDAGVLRSHSSAAVGASYEVAGLPKGVAFPIKQLTLIKPHVKTIDFLARDCLLFFGDRIRGAIAGQRNNI